MNCFPFPIGPRPGTIAERLFPHGAGGLPTYFRCCETWDEAAAAAWGGWGEEKSVGAGNSQRNYEFSYLCIRLGCLTLVSIHRELVFCDWKSYCIWSECNGILILASGYRIETVNGWKIWWQKERKSTRAPWSCRWKSQIARCSRGNSRSFEFHWIFINSICGRLSTLLVL